VLEAGWLGPLQWHPNCLWAMAILLAGRAWAVAAAPAARSDMMALSKTAQQPAGGGQLPDPWHSLCAACGSNWLRSLQYMSVVSCTMSGEVTCLWGLRLPEPACHGTCCKYCAPLGVALLVGRHGQCIRKPVVTCGGSRLIRRRRRVCMLIMLNTAASAHIIASSSACTTSTSSLR
jgi:hypothetical protein